MEVEESDSNVFKEIWQVIKGNRPLQILALSGAIMKLLAQLIGDQAFLVILFGIALGNFGLSGQLGLISVIPNFLLIAVLTRIASTKGMKRSYMISVSLFITFSVILGGILFFSADTTQIFANGWGATAILFTAAWVGFRTFITYPNSVILTMSADITDYELDRSGKYSSGLIGTVFSFVESISSSMVPVLIGFLVALIGYTDVYPVATEALTPNLFNIVLVLLVGFPVIFGLLVLLLIKIYLLDSDVMAQVQASLAEKRAARDAELAE